MGSAAPQHAPVAGAERIEVLDVLRGFAVLGILLVNVQALSGHEFLAPEAARALPGAGLDPALEFLVAWLVQGKFYSLFGFLFGVGFVLFTRRAEARGAPPAALFRRRMLALLVIGLCHGLLLWFGDILVTYALLGFLLVPFLRARERTLLRWSAAMLLAPLLVHGVLLAASALGASDAGASTDEGAPAWVARAIAAFAHGSYADVVRANATLTLVGFVLRRVLHMQGFRVFGMFLLGTAAGRRDLLRGDPRRAATLAALVRWGLLIGLPASAVAAALPPAEWLPEASWSALADTALESLGDLSLCLAYGAGLVLLCERPAAARWLRPLAPVGRTALSNYLLQSLACVAIFYGIGGGLFMRVSLARCLLLALGLFALEVAGSRLWLARFPHGPVEWAWRRFTYRRAPGLA